MLLDCVIIGGGPAGLSAALVLGRARRTVALFDDGQPRHAVTRETHGFLTQDGVSPAQFRERAHADIGRYDSVRRYSDRVVRIEPFAPSGGRGTFRLETASGEQFRCRKLILATGLRERLPAIPGLRECYGTSLFSCPYCDGWERRDRPLAVIAEVPGHGFHLAKTAWQWSRDLWLCTHGARLDDEQRRLCETFGIAYREGRIRAIVHTGGHIERIRFEDGEEIARCGGFVAADWFPGTAFAEELGCRLNERGGIETDAFGRTSVEGVFAAGDAAVIMPAQLIVAAADGSRAAMGVNGDLIHERFEAGVPPSRAPSDAESGAIFDSV